MTLSHIHRLALRLGVMAVMAATPMTVMPAAAFAADIQKLTADAAAGNAQAQFDLANIYMKGDGVPLNMAEGIRWCRMAAEQGLPAAQAQLGLKYRTEQGLAADPVEADKWLVLASEGDTHFVTVLRMVEGHMTSQQVRDGHAAAEQWKTQRAAAASQAAASPAATSSAAQ
ncbi:MAG: tetratricopeptide repeat protein [Asticcacaulis sp.]